MTTLLSLSTPSTDEAGLIGQMSSALSRHNAANLTAEGYYDGSHVTEQFGISTPPSMQDIDAVAGWPGTVVDVLEERLDWTGWQSDGDPLDLATVFAQNRLGVEAGMAHLDALIFGVSFVTVGTGYEGEPSPLVTVHSPKTMTTLWDARSRRASAGLSEVADENGRPIARTLYLPNETVRLALRGSSWAVEDRDRHNMGRLPVIPVANRQRASRDYGRSEITRAVRYYTDAAVRTLIGMEVNREFYSSPQRVALNVDEKAFQDEAGNPVSQWTSIQGRVWVIPPNEDGQPAASVEQFTPASPAPYVEQVKTQAILLAAEAGIPAAYMGFATDNPASADAIRAGEARLVKRAERRQATFGSAWLEVARLALLVRDGAVPADFDATVSCRWRDAATPTRAAAADEVTKLVAAGILPAESQVAMDRIGLTPAEQQMIEADRRRAQARSAILALTGDGVEG